MKRFSKDVRKVPYSSVVLSGFFIPGVLLLLLVRTRFHFRIYIVSLALIVIVINPPTRIELAKGVPQPRTGDVLERGALRKAEDIELDFRFHLIFYFWYHDGGGGSARCM